MSRETQQEETYNADVAEKRAKVWADSNKDPKYLCSEPVENVGMAMRGLVHSLRVNYIEVRDRNLSYEGLCGDVVARMDNVMNVVNETRGAGHRPRKFVKYRGLCLIDMIRWLTYQHMETVEPLEQRIKEQELTACYLCECLQAGPTIYRFMDEPDRPVFFSLVAGLRALENPKHLKWKDKEIDRITQNILPREIKKMRTYDTKVTVKTAELEDFLGPESDDYPDWAG